MNTPTVFRWPLLALCLVAVHSLFGAAENIGTKDENFTFKKGVNISHWLSQNFAERPYAAPWFGEDDVAWIAEQGFDHIRLPVDVRLVIKDDGSLDETKVKPIADCIGWSRKHGLGLVLDAHFLPGADFNSDRADTRVFTDAALQEKVAGVWRALAKRFAKEGPWVRFEILNEPIAQENRQVNPFMHRMLAAIRESNPTRVVYVTSNRWSQFATVPDVELPNDPNVALTIHNYEPMVFTHQRAHWVGFKDSMPPVKFPGAIPDYKPHMNRPGDYGKPGEMLDEQPMNAAFEKVEQWVAKTRPGLDVYVSEFGVYRTADAQSMRNWISALVRNCEQRGWAWAVWDYQGGFAVRDSKGNGTPILEGLGLKPKGR